LATFDEVFNHYRRYVGLPWQQDVPPAGRVWIVWYEKSMERRIRGQLHEFQHATRAAGHGWSHLDLAPLFPAWLASHEFFQALLDQPEEIRGLLPEFEAHLVETVRGALLSCESNDVLALTGCGSLFGLSRVSALIANVSSSISGRLLLTFPGRHSSGVYRLLDARDGWNYHAVPIPADAL
jgi:hypothetical protein